jgi:prolyl-tRNA synthetase
MSSGLVNFIQNEIEQTMLQNCTFACISLEKLAETVDHIEKLEAVLQKVLARCSWYEITLYNDVEEIIRKALEGKDD